MKKEGNLVMNREIGILSEVYRSIIQLYATMPIRPPIACLALGLTNASNMFTSLLYPSQSFHQFTHH